MGSTEPDEGLHQIEGVLYPLHAEYRPEHHSALAKTLETGWSRPSRCRGMKTPRIHPVIDLRDPARSDSDSLAKVAFLMFRERDETAHQRGVNPPEPFVLGV